MIARALVAVIALSGFAAPAFADEASTPQLPAFAQGQPDVSPWAGFYAGSEIMGGFGRHAKGLVGGDVFVGYERTLPSNWVIGFQASTGFSPGFFNDSRFTGYNFAETSVKVGYRMGRLTPFMTASAGLARPNFRGYGYSGADDSINSLFSSGPDLRAFGSVGAGFDYAVTDRLTVGVSVKGGMANGRSLLLAP